MTLTRAGAAGNLLDGRFEIHRISDTEFELVGINWPQSVSDTYTLTVGGAGILDPAGNSAAGTQAVSWVIDLVPPLPPGGFGVTPDRGFSSTDLLTNTGVVSLTGTASEI